LDKREAQNSLLFRVQMPKIFLLAEIKKTFAE
jgi:hypothetical protein